MALLYLDGYGERNRFALRPKIYWLIGAIFEFTHQIFDRADFRVEVRRAETDQAHEMTVRAADRPIPKFPDQRLATLVLALAGTAVEHFHRDHIFERRLFGVVLAKANVGPAGMTR